MIIIIMIRKPSYGSPKKPNKKTVNFLGRFVFVAVILIQPPGGTTTPCFSSHEFFQVSLKKKNMQVMFHNVLTPYFNN